ncbi:hypothetical protein HPB47_017728 [Ixodes persulcatus]|uniref:Uncharacterized protein n=1 Tax=Ixodes persulcatus TaxID=34615 RepID=A0AC60QNF3_IXOPE|nr:hypothetical protein HPB47_017728 [Ixodes persulcatus]
MLRLSVYADKHHQSFAPINIIHHVEMRSDNEGRPRKRGRPPVIPRDTVKGFTDVEIHRFIKSYRKFSAHGKRLHAVALDAELQEKPQADLKRLANLLRSGCKQAMNARRSSCLEVSVNPKSVLSSYQELAVLDTVLPCIAEEGRHWTLDLATKDPHFDAPWGVAEDSRLLMGIYEQGIGSWEAIKMGAGLGLTDKILPDGEQLKPQKHLQIRTDYLLKTLRNVHARQVAFKEGEEKPKRGRKTRPEKVHLSKATADNEDSNNSDDASSTKPRKSKALAQDETHQSNLAAVIDSHQRSRPRGTERPDAKPSAERSPKTKRKKDSFTSPV